MMSKRWQRKHLRASALFTALALLVMAASIVTMLITVQRVSIRRTTAMLETDQAYYHTFLVEQWAFSQLSEWYRERLDFHEDAALQFPQVQLQDGLITGKIEDWQAKINLYSFLLPKAAELFKPAFTKKLINNNEEQISTLMDNIRIRMQRIPRLKMVSELRSVEDMSAEQYQALMPFLAMLPNAAARINVNGISGALLMDIFPDVSSTDMQTFLDTRREKGGIKSVGELKKLLPNTTFPAGIFTTNSRYYLVTAKVDHAGYQLRVYTLIQISGNRNQPRIDVLWRSWNTI